MKLGLSSLARFEHQALLLLRAGLGLLIAYHAYPHFMGGPPQWRKVGGAIAAIGVDSGFPVWGFIGASALFFGGLFLTVGLFSRAWALLIACSLAIAAIANFRADELPEAIHAFELTIVFAAISVLGPGRFAIDTKLD